MSNMEKALSKIRETIERGPFKPEQTSLEKFQCPSWYRNGKFGIFIHWGVYSVPAFGNEWYPRKMYEQGSPEFEYHRKNFGLHKDFGYKDFIPLFRAENFNPEKWAEIFRAAGAKFVVPVAEHHDGFAMYESSFNPWNAAAMGPKKDVIGELSRAVRQAGMTLGLSSHRAEHYWFFNQGMKFDSDVCNPENVSLYGMAGETPYALEREEHSRYHSARPSEAIQLDWLVNTCDFVDKYRPSLVWFDWWINNFGYRKVLREFAAYYYNRCAEWGVEGAINYKYQAYSPDCAVFDIERGQLKNIYPLFWQNDTSISTNTWGYIRGELYKKWQDIVADLADVVSKNGALLLNVGPRPDGTLPEEDQEILRNIGKWLETNGEAIYDTRPYYVYGEGPTAVREGSFMDTARAAFKGGDLRYTAKGEDTIYIIVLGGTAGGGLIRSYALAEWSNSAPGEIISAEIPGHGRVEFERDRDSLRIKTGFDSAEPFVVKLNVRY